MSGDGDVNWNSGDCSNEEVEELFAFLGDVEKGSEMENHFPLSPKIEFSLDAFIWEDVKLSDSGVSFPEHYLDCEQELVQASSTAPCALPTSAATTTMFIPKLEVLQENSNLPPDSLVESTLLYEETASESDEGEGAVPKAFNSHPLLTVYQLDDERLSDMSLKKLKALCASDEPHYQQLKAYRRTCLNRHYARSSRSKQQKKTICLASELEKAKGVINRLTKEKADQATTIKYLKLELDIMRNLSHSQTL